MQERYIQGEKLASLGFLISGIIHEINTPIGFITFNIPILRDYLQGLLSIIDQYAREQPELRLCGMPYQEFREDIFKLLDNIQHGSERINRIVLQLKAFVKRKHSLKLRETRLKEVIEEAVSICRAKIQRMVKRFMLDIAQDLPSIVTDAEALEQIIVNFLINAAQAANKADSWVKLSARTNDAQYGSVIIEVSDNGCGMDERTKNRIFEPFFTTKESSEGTGLGLSVCKGLARRIGAAIEVESTEGEGSTFRLIIPARQGSSETLRRRFSLP